MPDCAICMEPTNKTKRKHIVCPYCSCDLCSLCMKTTLLDDVSPEPKCPGCKAVYNRHILLSMFPVSFLTKDYKIHREKVLLDGEKSRLPESQVHAEKYLKSKKIMDERNKIVAEKYKILEETKIYKDHREAKKEYDEYTTKNTQIYKNPVKQAIFDALWKKERDAKTLLKSSTEYVEWKITNRMTNALYNHQRIIGTFGTYEPRTYDARGVRIEPEKKEREKHFIKACPMKDCRGFLSTSWKCGICETHICKDCNDPKKDHKDDEHHCDPDKVASVKMIAKETTACPKCAVPVFRISGCDQIWCTNCHTAFNHKTGVIEIGTIHNPHYFEYMRQNNLAIPANPNAIIRDACGGNNWAIQDRLIVLERTVMTPTSIYHANYKYYKALLNRYIQVNDASYQALRHLQTTVRSFQNDEKKQKLRVLYLTKEIDEKKWKYLLQRDEKGLARERAKLQLLEMFIAAARQIFEEVINNPSFDPIKMIEDLNNLMKFVNEQSVFLLKDYQNTTPGYDYNWNDDLWKYIPCKKTKKSTGKTVKKHDEIRHVIDSDTSDSDTSDSDTSDSDTSDEDDGVAWGGAGVAPPKKK
jgi:hypothetical protein